MTKRTGKPADSAPRSYVVRIYRRTPESLAGQVQDVLTGQTWVFRTLSGLWRALGGRSGSSSSTNDSQEIER
jgi:hypothetical protein